MWTRTIVVGAVVLISLSCGDSGQQQSDQQVERSDAMQTYREREAAARDRRTRAAEQQAAERLRQDPAEALAAAQRVADENALRRREARGLAEPTPPVPNRDDPTRWENPEPGIAAACSPTEVGVRACIGVVGEPRAVLIESNLHLLAGDVVGVAVDGKFFTARAERDMGNIVWTGTEADRMIAALRRDDEAIIAHADGVQFRVSLRGSSAAIGTALR